MSGWRNEAHIERLKIHKAAGMSASEIARALNREFKDAAYTRNGVIGKIHRLGLSFSRPSKPARRLTSRSPLPKVALPTPSRPEATAPVEINVRAFTPRDGHNAVPFGSPGCRWPVDGEGADLLCCGQPRGDNEVSYCDAHARMSRPAPETKKRLDRYLNIPRARRAA